MLINQLDRSSDPTQLTRKAMVEYASFELEYLKLVVAGIVSSEAKEISATSAINLTREVKTKQMKPTEGQAVLRRFASDEAAWLRLTDDDAYRLAPRFIAEMGPYLKQVHGTDVGDCGLCHQLVVRDSKCGSCPATFHLYCLTTLHDKCNGCKGDVAPRGKGRPRSSRDKPASRKRRQTIEKPALEDSSEDSD